MVERDEAAWLAWRAAGITATDVARAVSGRYGGAYAVVTEKLGLIEREPPNERMTRGHRWQQPIADAVHALTGLHVVGEEAWCSHSVDTWARATVDGLLADRPEATPDDLLGVLEVKTRGLDARAAWDYWSAQVQWQLYVTGLDRAVVADAVIDDDNDRLVSLRLVEIEAEPDVADDLHDRALMLRQHIEEGTLPAPDTPAALDYVKTVNLDVADDAEVVDLEPIADDVRRFAEIKAAVKAVTEERDELEARIRDAVGLATVGVVDGIRVSISRPSLALTREAEETLLGDFPHLGRLVLDRDRAKAEVPDLYNSLRRPVGARRLTIKETP